VVTAPKLVVADVKLKPAKPDAGGGEKVGAVLVLSGTPKRGLTVEGAAGSVPPPPPLPPKLNVVDGGAVAGGGNDPNEVAAAAGGAVVVGTAVVVEGLVASTADEKWSGRARTL
jgi:hypothetical protein